MPSINGDVPFDSRLQMKRPELAAKKCLNFRKGCNNNGLPPVKPQSDESANSCFLNCRLEDAALVSKMRKPFDALAVGVLVNKSG